MATRRNTDKIRGHPGDNLHHPADLENLITNCPDDQPENEKRLVSAIQEVLESAGMPTLYSFQEGH
jgi:hypothetical protein